LKTIKRNILEIWKDNQSKKLNTARIQPKAVVK